MMVAIVAFMLMVALPCSVQHTAVGRQETTAAQHS